MSKKTISHTGLADKPVIKPSANQTASLENKVLLLAVTNRNGEFAISPLDLESEVDNQTPLTEAERQLFEKSHAEFTQHKGGVEKGLKALHAMFAGQLPREKFANFENYCFATYDLGISEERLAELKGKANRLRLNGFQCAKGGA